MYWFLIACLVNFAVVVSVLFAVFTHYRTESLRQVISWYATLAFPYLLLGILALGWWTATLEYTFHDFFVLFAVVLSLQTIIFYRIHMGLTQRREFSYYLLFYFLTFLLVFFSLDYFFYALLLVSFLLLLLLFLSLTSSSISKKSALFMGISYILLAILTLAGYFFFAVDFFISQIFITFVFFLFTLFFQRDLPSYKLTEVGTQEYGEESLFLFFARYFVFVIIFAMLVLLSTIGIHEAGHVFAARTSGCTYSAVLFEIGTYPRTEALCPTLQNKLFVTLAGPAVPIILALFLFILGGRLMKEIALLMTGFDLIASTKDIFEIGAGGNLVLATLFSGAVLLLAGIIYLAKFRLLEQNVSSFSYF